MNLEQLRGFSEVARTEHFTRAAEQLHVAQPTLSRQIATLEAELGVSLLSRARGRVGLTDAGRRLLPIARRMLADAEAVQEEMADLAGLRKGSLRIGATPTLCTSLLADALVEYRAQYPGVELDILERGSRTLITALMEGEIDLALIVTSVASGAARAVLEREAILRERLVVVSAAAQSDPFGDRPAVTLRELAEVPQISLPENYDLRVALDAGFHAVAREPMIAVSGVEMDAALSFAKRGIGVAVVPAMVAAARSGLRVTPFADAQLTRTISIARRADVAPTGAGAALQAMLRTVANRLADEPGSYVERG